MNIRNLLCTAAFCAVAGLGAGHASAAESQDTIKIALNEWTGQQLSARIAAELLRKMDYKVELVTAGGLPQFTAMAKGELHANPEVWDNSITDIYTNGLASGELVNLGDLGLKPRDGWIYPPYMAELCPGLPSYQALYDCTQAFSNAETFPDGRLIAYPADWGTRSQQLVAALELPFKAVPGGSEGAMIAELKGAIAAKQPIVMMMWEPHWIFSQMDLNWVEWDASDGNCVESEESRGKACGFAQAHVNKIVSASFPDKWPNAAKFMEKYTLTNDEQSRLIFEVDQDHRPIEEVVAEWIDQNKDKWSVWTAP
ncbi:glycine betaine/proline transport system substrate-binding protein [Hoeflea marina]|uniref:Glycine betaine/proline transport system substrate-binding protein n=1 Tax=Hoeflea marina TaxID=274592 RepID=A0A317PWD6_9HYPH|nr:ABC transporter substrate-binding protein [Hoeflea marina]PWW03780.1 glycine betaine/proline transport system substrate-binding protein [Hoeflea marina]